MVLLNSSLLKPKTTLKTVVFFFVGQLNVQMSFVKLIVTRQLKEMQVIRLFDYAVKCNMTGLSEQLNL